MFLKKIHIFEGTFYESIKWIGHFMFLYRALWCNYVMLTNKMHFLMF